MPQLPLKSNTFVANRGGANPPAPRRRLSLAATTVAYATAALIVLLLALTIATAAAAQSQPIEDDPDDIVFTKLDAGRYVTCGLTASGYVRCWGLVTRAPIRSPSDGYLDITVTDTYTCGVAANGRLDCWSHSPGLIQGPPDHDPDGTPDSGDEFAPTFSAIDIDVGMGCGILDHQNHQIEGSLFCWGIGSYGPRRLPPSELDDVPITVLDIGPQGGCVLPSSDQVPICWDRFNRITFGEPNIAMTDVTTTGYDACGVVRDAGTARGVTYAPGEIECWGEDTYNVVSSHPTRGIYKAVSVHITHACALRTDNTVVCWGDGNANLGFDPGHMAPPRELAIATFDSIATSRYHTCGILNAENGQTAGKVECWGYQDIDVLFAGGLPYFDQGATTPYERRAPLPKLATAPGKIIAGGFATCALTADDGAQCWGSENAPWQLQNDIEDVAITDNTTCFLMTDGSVSCFGSDDKGVQTGTGSMFFSNAVDADLSAPGFSGIYGSRTALVCGLLDDTHGADARKPQCWGRNTEGQAVAPGQTLGANNHIADFGVATYSMLHGGAQFACGLHDDTPPQTAGTLVCWGAVPADVQLPAELARATFSYFEVNITSTAICALEDGQGTQTAGKVRCWGAGHFEEDGTFHPFEDVPDDVASRRFSQISHGHHHVCGITIGDQRMTCWGENDAGQLDVPASYANAAFVEVAAGYYHSCGVTDDGAVVCWGADGDLDTAGIQVVNADRQIINAGQADPPPGPTSTPTPTTTPTVTPTATSTLTPEEIATATAVAEAATATSIAATFTAAINLTATATTLNTCGGAFGGYDASIDIGRVPSNSISRIAPTVREIAITSGETVRFRIAVYGDQNIRNDRLLADGVPLIWKLNGAVIDATFGGGSMLTHVAPTTHGSYEVTATVCDRACRGDAQACTASFALNVGAPSIAPSPVPTPMNPVGFIPEAIADPDGGQYAVFTPEEGGKFDSNDGYTITAAPGTVNNSTFIGIRMARAGEASNVGETHQRYAVGGSWHAVEAADANGAQLRDHTFNRPATVCLPLPAELRSRISDLALIAANPDGSQTVLGAAARFDARGDLQVCGRLSRLPTTLAVASRGAPGALPTATPSPTAQLPDTGGMAPMTMSIRSGWLAWLLLLGAAMSVLALTLVLARRAPSR